MNVEHVIENTTRNNAARSFPARSQKPPGAGPRPRFNPVLVISVLLVILIGVIFQAVELGYLHPPANELWPLSVAVSALWALVSAVRGGPIATEAFHFWPLILVGPGVAAFLETL